MIQVLEIVRNDEVSFINDHWKKIVTHSAEVDMNIAISENKSYQKCTATLIGVPCYVLPNVNRMSRKDKLRLLFSRFTKDLRKAQRTAVKNVFYQIKPDIIHFHELSLALKFRDLIKETQIPFTISVAEVEIQLIPFLKKTNSDDIRSILKLARRIHFHSNTLLNKALEVTPSIKSKSRVIHPTLNAIGATQEQKLPIIDNQMFTNGPLRWYRGLSDLLVACHRLKVEHHKKFVLKIGGEGEMRGELEYMTRDLQLDDYVKFLGHLDNKGLKEEMDQAALYVDASVVRGLPLDLILALKTSKSIATTCDEIVLDFLHTGCDNFSVLTESDPENMAKELSLALDKARNKDSEKDFIFKEGIDSEKYAFEFQEFWKEAVRNQ